MKLQLNVYSLFLTSKYFESINDYINFDVPQEEKESVTKLIERIKSKV